MIVVPQLAGHEQLLAGHACFGDGGAHLRFVSVDCGRVEVAVAGLNGGDHGCLGGPAGLPYAEPHLGMLAPSFSVNRAVVTLSGIARKFSTSRATSPIGKRQSSGILPPMPRLHAYPPDLARYVVANWPETAKLTLAPELLEEALAVAFQASLTVEEARPTRFRLLLTPPSQLPEAGTPKQGVLRLQFVEPARSTPMSCAVSPLPCPSRRR